MKLVPVFAAAALAAGLSGCVGAGVAVGPHHATVGVAYYDDAYGPYYGGYWGEDGYFYYYADSARVRVVRDNDRHFRREAADRFHRIEVHERRNEQRREENREERREERRDNNDNNH